MKNDDFMYVAQRMREIASDREKRWRGNVVYVDWRPFDLAKSMEDSDRLICKVLSENNKQGRMA